MTHTVNKLNHNGFQIRLDEIQKTPNSIKSTCTFSNEVNDYRLVYDFFFTGERIKNVRIESLENPDVYFELKKGLSEKEYLDIFTNFIK